jgi:guanylate kinase
MNTKPGKLVVISGPSGSGKTTILKRLLENPPRPLVLSVSATTREKRPGEVDGVDYHFLTPDRFQQRRLHGDFLECCEVFGSGTWYGTLRSVVDTGLAEGKWVVLEIDVQGTMNTLKHYPHAITIFLRPDSEEELEQRLVRRGTEDDDAIAARLATAKRELTQADRYQFQVINDNVDRAVQEITDILASTGD